MKVRLVVDLPTGDGKVWRTRGSVLELPDRQARRLCAAGAVVPVPAGSLVDEVIAPTPDESIDAED